MLASRRLALILTAALGALPSSAMAQPADDRTINLICYGEGEKPTTEVHSGWEWDRHEDRYRRADRVESGTAQFDTFVTVQIAGEQGRIRLPKKLIPPINAGGSDRWWALYDVIVGQNEIRARYRLNGLNKPKIVIDRITGGISIDGIEHFNGRCDAVDQGSRRF
jgi:hypothetical protein